MRIKILLVCSILLIVIAGCSPQPSVPSEAPVTDTPLISPTDTVPPAPTATPTPPPPPLPAVTSPALTHVDFQDASYGWGIAINDNGYILRTVDGGAIWLNATPPEIGTVSYSTGLFVLDTNDAWVLNPAADFFTGTLYRTSDGGLTWTSNPVPFGGGMLQFLDATTGRALADRGAGAGSQAVEMYQTSDGGVTWTSVFHNDPTQPGSSDSLPLSGIKNGMTFLDADTGWVTGSRPMDGDIYLFVTHDGGVSWAQQSIPLPAGYENYMYVAQAPVFFGNDGFLPLMVYLSNLTEFTFYTTHDGGTTWSGDPTDANRVVTPGQYAWADAQHGWAWDGGANLYLTSDGAQTWAGMAASLDLSQRLMQLDFVPASAGGFVGWALASADETNPQQLYQTSDNGASWTQLVP